MRPLWKDVLIAIWLGMIMPGILIHIVTAKEKYQETLQTPPLQTESVSNSVPLITVQSMDGKQIETDIHTYLTGVLLAEMPAVFHSEALKAQAVAAGTYTWKAVTTGGKHGDGSVCMNAGCCQAYINPAEYESLGGTSQNLQKVREAVEATSGFVLAYDGELIEATYFSSSGGSTEAAVAVWGTDYPYLQAVSSPEAVREETVRFSRTDFLNRLGISETDKREDLFGSVTQTEGGGVAYLEISGETITGVQMRSILGLRSTAFQIHPEGNFITITTKGYGHRVGMSQYGANAMAESGSTWQEILQHYYPGTTLYPAY